MSRPNEPAPEDEVDPAAAPEARPDQSAPATPSDESPDRDTPAWEGAEPADGVGLIDPRPEIPTPPGL